MKKISLLSILLILLLVSLPVFASGAKEKGNEKIELTVGVWDKNQEPVIQKILDLYHEKNPNVTAKTVLTPYKGREYWTKLEASTIGGTAPDVFWMNALNVEKYIEGGVLADLSSAMKENKIDATNFPPALLELYHYNNKYYAVPKDFDTNALWFNKEIFDEAGMEYPNDNWSWEKMVEVARALTNPEKGIYGLDAPLDFQTNYYNTVFGAGGYILNKDKTKTGYNDPKTVEGIQIWIDLIKEGISPSFTDMTDTSVDVMFMSGKLAMHWAGSYMTPEYMHNEDINSKIDLVEAPYYKKKANLINGLGYAVYEMGKHKEEAIKLAMFLGSEEAMKIQGESGAVISSRKDAQKYFAQSNPSINLKAYTNQADLATMLPATKSSIELFNAETKWLKQAFALLKPLEEVTAELQKEADEILKRQMDE